MPRSSNHGGFRKRKQREDDYGNVGVLRKDLSEIADVKLEFSKRTHNSSPSASNESMNVSEMLERQMNGETKSGDMVVYLPAPKSVKSRSQRMQEKRNEILREFSERK